MRSCGGRSGESALCLGIFSRVCDGPSWFRPIDVWFSTQIPPHESHFLRQARRWSRNAEACDLAQEAYLKLLQMENWGAIREPRSYMVTMIRNLVLQRVRRDQVVAITDIPAPSLAEMRDEAPGVFETVAAREALLDLLAEVERLPPVRQRVIRMRKFEERSPREIAAALGSSSTTAMAASTSLFLDDRYHRAPDAITLRADELVNGVSSWKAKLGR